MRIDRISMGVERTLSVEEKKTRPRTPKRENKKERTIVITTNYSVYVFWK